MQKVLAITAACIALAAAGVYVLNSGRNQSPRAGSETGRPLEDAGRNVDFTTSLRTTPLAVPGNPLVQADPPMHATASPRPDYSTTPRPVGGSVEASFLTDGLLNDGATDVLGSTPFDHAVTQVKREAGAHNPEFQMAYRIQLEDSLKPFASVAQLVRYECGANICIGSIRTFDAEWIDQWMVDLRQMATLPMPSFSRRTLTLAPQNHELRFIFTTKPGPGGFISRRPPAAG